MKVISIRVDEKEKQQLNQKAQQDDTTISQILRRLIRNYLQGGEQV